VPTNCPGGCSNGIIHSGGAFNRCPQHGHHIAEFAQETGGPKVPHGGSERFNDQSGRTFEPTGEFRPAKSGEFRIFAQDWKSRKGSRIYGADLEESTPAIILREVRPESPFAAGLGMDYVDPDGDVLRIRSSAEKPGLLLLSIFNDGQVSSAYADPALILARLKAHLGEADQ
jgi:hypothetical protein